MIIGEIRRYLRDNNSIRVSRSLRDIAYKAIYTRETYMKQHLKEPTVTEIAQEIGIEKEMIVYALDAIQNPVSLFEPVYTEGGDTLYVRTALLRRKNSDGSGSGNRHLPGTGQSPGEKCLKIHAQLSAHLKVTVHSVFSSTRKALSYFPVIEILQKNFYNIKSSPVFILTRLLT